MGKIELKPCPFCGGEAEFDINDSQEPEMFWLYAVGCSFFGCIAYSQFSTHFHTKEEAANRWNTRHERTCKVIPRYYEGSFGVDELAGHNCSACGTDEIDDEMNFCPNCGAKVVS